MPVVQSRYPRVFIPDNLTLPQHFLSCMERNSSRVAYIDGKTGVQMTHGELGNLIRRAACGYQRLGVSPGDVLLICSPNCVQYIISIVSFQLAGGVVSTCNPRYTFSELSNQADDCKPRFFALAPELIKMSALLKRRYSTVHSIHILEKEMVTKNSTNSSSSPKISEFRYFSELYGFGDNWRFTEPLLDPRSALAFLPYSSGTTGLPKGTQLTHYNVMANLHQINHPDLIPYAFSSEENICMQIMPLYHIYGLVVLMGVALQSGMTFIMVRQFDFLEMLELIQRYRVTVLHIAPPIAVALAKHPAVTQFDTSSLSAVISGGASLGAALHREVRDRLGVKVGQGYGMTELSPVSHLVPLGEDLPGAIGRVIPNTEVKVVDINTGKVLGPELNGEICVRGPQVMKGYLNRPDVTRSTVKSDGWLHTGDIGYYNTDHVFYVVDRLKELIKYKGFQVAPAELESLLLTHPSVANACVVGVPDEISGELPRAYLVLKPDSAGCTEESVQEWFSQQVAPHKKLRGGVKFVESLPQTPSGKMLRRILRDNSLATDKNKVPPKSNL